ncbi:PRC-barrel domain containing protein [Bacillaceae bacterium SIJ1]|uniref:PRC-barrel domain-containing protein n=1 Tax=Litoribacterium kuwaitense TaxID=1398745 RepID=UPI0013EC25B5|nr:PRC-barrel domain-containing protein [Litoribacterium kuwaitense]NGP46129.1 PRC-barrel domain containing protein [Litoribacterium kuwaitense]
MLYKGKELESYKLGATDGDIGKIEDFYFDESQFVVRYIVADTRTWFFGGEVLLSPEAFQKVDPSDRIVHVNLTKDQIKDSPKPNQEQPINRQFEKDLSDFHGWRYYWLSAGGAGAGYNTPGTGAPGPVVPVAPVPEEAGSHSQRNLDETVDETHEGYEEKELEEHLQHENSQLQSMDDLKGYEVHVKEGYVGKIDDMILEDGTWKIRYLVVDVGIGIDTKLVLISPDWVKEISWIDQTITAPLEHDLVEHAPVFEEDQPLTREYEEKLYDYYNQQRYW